MTQPYFLAHCQHSIIVSSIGINFTLIRLGVQNAVFFTSNISLLGCGEEWKSSLSLLRLVLRRFAVGFFVACIDDACGSLWLRSTMFFCKLCPYLAPAQADVWLPAPCWSLSLHFERQSIRTVVVSLADLQSPFQLEARETSLSSVTPHESHGELGRESLLCCSIEGCLLPSLLPLLPLPALCKSSTLKPLRHKGGQKAAQFSALSSLPNLSFMSPPQPGTTGVGRDRARPIYILLSCFFLPLQ